MAVDFQKPDTDKIYTQPRDGLPFFIVVQVSQRRHAVAQFESNAGGLYATTYVVVTEPMSWQDAQERCAELTAEKNQALYPHYQNVYR